ncbi:MAG: response regulator [Lysobacteraceae bacterium]
MNPAQADATRRAAPRILLAEDDEISREFLLDALTRLPAEVTAVADGAEARQRLLQEPFDLVLLDRGLLSLDAMAIREAVLAGGGGGGNETTPMLALSADVDPALRERFRTLGFIDLLAKPISASALRTAARAALPVSVRDWDDEQALSAANGSPEIVTRLRELLLADLPRQRRQIIDAVEAGDPAAAHDVLHRLKAACAFCGATRLASACSALDDALQTPADPDRVRTALWEFEAATSRYELPS